MLKDDKNKNPPKQQIQGPENKYFDLRKIEANNWPQLLPKNWALVLVTSNRNWSIWGQFGISVEICIFCKFFNLTIQNIHLGNIYRNCKLCDFRQHPWILLPRSYQKSLNTTKTHNSSRGVFEDRFGDIKHRITINNVRYDPIPDGEKFVLSRHSLTFNCEKNNMFLNNFMFHWCLES